MLTDGGSVAVTTLPLLPVFCTIGAEPGAPPLLVMVRSPPVVSPPVSVTTRSLDEPPPPPLSGAAATSVIVVLPPPKLAAKVDRKGVVSGKSVGSTCGLRGSRDH